MKRVSSLFLLMTLIAACAVAVVVLQAAHAGSRPAQLACIFLLPVCVYAAISIPLYLLLYGIGSFNRYIDTQASVHDSPFAEERLPTQIIAPTVSEDAK